MKELASAMAVVNAAKRKLDRSISRYNAEVEKATERYSNEVFGLYTELVPAVEAYNQAVSGLQEIISDTAERIRDEYEWRSEEWKETEKGECYLEWVEEWEDVHLEEFHIEEPGEIEIEGVVGPYGPLKQVMILDIRPGRTI